MYVIEAARLAQGYCIVAICCHPFSVFFFSLSFDKSLLHTPCRKSFSLLRRRETPEPECSSWSVYVLHYVPMPELYNNLVREDNNLSPYITLSMLLGQTRYSPKLFGHISTMNCNCFSLPSFCAVLVDH